MWEAENPEFKGPRAHGACGAQGGCHLIGGLPYLLSVPQSTQRDKWLSYTRATMIEEVVAVMGDNSH